MSVIAFDLPLAHMPMYTRTCTCTHTSVLRRASRHREVPEEETVFSVSSYPSPPWCQVQLSQRQVASRKVYNTTFDSYRGRVEKIFAQVTHHRIFKGKNHLHFNMLVSCVHIVLHTTAQWTRDNPQYEGYGDWSHFNN